MIEPDAAINPGNSGGPVGSTRTSCLDSRSSWPIRRGIKHKVGTVDVVPQGAISRANQDALVSVVLAGPGVHTVTIESGGASFAQYAFNVKLR